jgi:ankyrin repeat protein
MPLFARKQSVSRNDSKKDLVVALLKDAEEGRLEAVSKVINSGLLPVNSSDQHGKTALHLSAVNGHFPVAEFLVKAGADYNFQDKTGWTPLHSAACGRNEKLFMLLLQQDDIKGNRRQF